MKNKLFLIDAYALIYRSYYAFIKNPRFNSKWFNTSAILGFVNVLEEILKICIWNKFHLWRSNKFLEKGIDVPFLNSYLKTPQEIISLKEDSLHLYKNNSFKL